MSRVCVNPKSPELAKLAEESGISTAQLSAKIGLWMEENDSVEWPSLEQLGLTTVSNDINDDILENKTNKSSRKISRQEMAKHMQGATTKVEEMAYEMENRNLNKFEAIVKAAINNLEFKRKSISQHGLAGSSQEKVYAELLTTINGLNAKSALIEVLKEANSSINSYSKQFNSIIKDKEFTIKKLSNWRHFLKGYSWLNTAKELINSGLIDDADLKKLAFLNIDKLIGQRDSIIKAYTEKGLPILIDLMVQHTNYGEAVAKEEQEKFYRSLPKSTRNLFTLEEWLAEYTEANRQTIEDLTRSKLQEEFKVASKDINFLMRWLDNILDSPDILLSTAGSIYSTELFKANTENFIVRDKILSVLKKLEKFYHSKPWSSSEDMYSFMLEKDDKGKLTGHYVWKYKSSFFKDYITGREEIQNNDKIPTLELKAQAIAKFKNSLAPRNDIAYYEARWEFISDQFADGKITQEEYDALFENEKLVSFNGHRIAKGQHTLYKEGHIGQSTSLLIDEWEQEYDMIFREPIDKYKSAQWEELKKLAGSKSDDINTWSDADPRVEFFKLIVNLGKESDKKLPLKQRMRTRLPGALKTPGEHVKAGEGKGMVDNFTQRLKYVFTPEPEELTSEDAKDNPNKSFNQMKIDSAKSSLIDAEGVLHRTIPLRFTTKFEPKDMSFDVPTLYLGLYISTNKYAHKMAVLPEMQLIQQLLSERDVSLTDSKGKPILKDLFGGAVSRIKDARIFKPKNESTHASDQFNDWLSLVFFEEGFPKERWEKLLDQIGKYTSFRLLAFNILQGTANVMMGETMQKVEATAGQYVNHTDLNYATAYYYSNMGGVLNDIGKRAPENIVNLLTEKFRMLNEDAFTKYRKGTKMQQMFQQSNLFMLNHAGEHWMQSRFLLAMLHRQKAYDKDGNAIIFKNWKNLGKEVHASILDMYKVKHQKDEKGNIILSELMLDERVSLEKSNWTEEEQSRFMLKTKAIARQMHGAYSEEEMVAIQKFAIGRMIYQFRKFISPGVRKRYAKKYYNNQLGDFTEGNYRTFGRFMKALFLEMRAYSFAKMSNKAEHSGDWSDVKQKMYSSFTSREYANIRRTGMEMGVFFSTVAMIAFILPMLDDLDDDKDDLNTDFLNYLNYLTYRLFSEMSFFSNPLETMKLMQSPAASFSFYDDTMKMFFQIFSITEKYQRGEFKGDNKFLHQLKDLIPILRNYDKIRDIKSQTSQMKRANVVNMIFKDVENK